MAVAWKVFPPNKVAQQPKKTPMPRSAYLDDAIAAMLADYGSTFPSTWYPGGQPGSSAFATHITPDEERIKKLVFVFPSFSKAPRTYSGIPVVHAVAFGDKRTLRLCVTDLVNNTRRDVDVPLSSTSRAVNRRAADRVVREIRRALWCVGPATPDHYAE